MKISAETASSNRPQCTIRSQSIIDHTIENMLNASPAKGSERILLVPM
jgi:hypothetical protein